MLETKHGQLIINKFPDGGVTTDYRSDIGYVGKETYTLLVKIEGQPPVKLVYFFTIVQRGADDEQIVRYCGTKKLNLWKISQSDTPVNAAADVSAWLQSAQLSSLIASATLSLAGFANLPGTTIGTTTGEGPSAQITLDTDAAGHGWYVDEMPLDNTDDYLPTSDPTLWKAKAGSAAEGKMDLLSVLLHEYGHALGLEHSGDARDFMGASLQAGERRLPSAQELQIMAKLVAQLKEEPTAGDQPDVPTLPHDLPQDLPLNGLALAGLLSARRRSGTGTDSAAAATLNKLLSVNPTLQNAQFAQNSTQGWSVDGNVNFASSGNVNFASSGNVNFTSSGNVSGVPTPNSTAITLTEAPSSQTTLQQAFTLGANDRYLSFTVTSAKLHGAQASSDDPQNPGGPADAFEVALLDATTYQPLLGAFGLSRSDAALNLQSNSANATPP